MKPIKEATKDLATILQRARENAKSSRDSVDREEVNYECIKCKDLGGYLVKVEEEMTVRGQLERVLVDELIECECIKQRRIDRLTRSSAITEEFRKMSFGNFDKDQIAEVVKEAYDAAYEYVKSFLTIRKSRHNSIALIGRPGVGKTHLLMAVANNLISKGIEVIYFPWVEGFNELKGDLSILEERVRRLQKAEVLFVDDMWKGREKPSPFVLEQTFAIINYRYLNNLPVLISSERTFADMCRYDEAVGSRLKEMSKGHTVTIEGSIELNYRLRD